MDCGVAGRKLVAVDRPSRHSLGADEWVHPRMTGAHWPPVPAPECELVLDDQSESRPHVHVRGEESRSWLPTSRPRATSTAIPTTSPPGSCGREEQKKPESTVPIIIPSNRGGTVSSSPGRAHGPTGRSSCAGSSAWKMFCP